MISTIPKVQKGLEIVGKILKFRTSSLYREDTYTYIHIYIHKSTKARDYRSVRVIDDVFL